tara:strand:+ start:5517 stop:6821 length:1305 start_codon:yes stop_codon:yes gene_type:complete
MRTNTKARHAIKTHEGANSVPQNALQQLRRSTLSCMLFENEFYEDGQTIAARIRDLAAKVSARDVADLAIEAREKMNLRHVPLLLTVAVIDKRMGAAFDTAGLIERVCQRADEPGELLALYWKDGRRPIPAAMKRGLARALAKFDAYQLAKYDRKTDVKLADILRLTHPKPANDAMDKRYEGLVRGTLDTPDTWEAFLSSGADKKATFERMLDEGTLGYIALLRNLRGMDEAGVDSEKVRKAILARKGASRVLPFRYVAAARAAPRYEPELDEALSAAVEAMPVLGGETIVLVDVSGSMNQSLSARSDLKRMDAAATLASVIHGRTRIFTFSEKVVEVPPRRGMAGVEAIRRSQPHHGTWLGRAIEKVSRHEHDRIIVITDEQSHDAVGEPKVDKAYMINVASSERAVGHGAWTRISGFSENVLSWIHESERMK